MIEKSTRSKVTWIGGLVLALLSALLGYLGAGCSPLQAQRAAQTVDALDVACKSLVETTSTQPELVKGRAACREWLALR
jgi:hypothetical protein